MKISLKNLNLKEVEKLTREQLKDVLGGEVTNTDIPHGETCSNNCSDGKGGSRSVTHTCSSGEMCVAVAGDAIYCAGQKAKSC